MLDTEKRNENSRHIDRMTTAQMLQVIDRENHVAVEAVSDALPQIEQAVDAITRAMKAGGRLIYIGAGTSGRTGVIDAAECPPTFGVEPSRVVGILAGGRDCMFRASENAEDKGENGERDLKEIGLCAPDIVVGISAAGGAAYVIDALRYASSVGCTTVGLTCNPDTELGSVADIAIVTRTGAEVITGSTRMKAGTAQKLVLNMLSTCPMVHMGYVYENLMINLKASNIKLRDRMIRIVADILELDADEAEALLARADWNIKQAITLYAEVKKE